MTSLQVLRRWDVALTVILLPVIATGVQLSALAQVADGSWSWGWAAGSALAPVVIAAGAGWLFGLAAVLWFILGLFVPLARLKLRRQEA